MWEKFRDVRTLGAIGVLAFIAIVGILNLTVYTPEATVLRYLSAIEDGRVADAERIVWGDHVPDGVSVGLPADPANRPHDFTVIGSARTENVTTVDVSFTLGGQKVLTKFAMTEVPNWLPFRDWRFEIEPVATVLQTGSAPIRLLINGVLPGKENLTLVPVLAEVGSGSPWFDATDVSVSATTPEGVYLADLKPTPTPALTEVLEASTRDYLDDCAAQKILVPAECPFAGFTAMTVTAGPEWSIDTYPNLTVTSEDGEWVVKGDGKARLSVTLVDFATEKSEPYSELLLFTISGTLTGLDSNTPRVVVSNTVEF